MLFYFINNFFLYRSLLIEEKCRFLSNFSLQTAEIEIPGEFLLPKVRFCVLKLTLYLLI